MRLLSRSFPCDSARRPARDEAAERKSRGGPRKSAVLPTRVKPPDRAAKKTSRVFASVRDHSWVFVNVREHTRTYAP